MTNGPIEFLGEEPVREVPATESGGSDGLIQPAEPPGGARAARVDGMELGHTDEALTGGEVLGMLRRGGDYVGSLREQRTGEPDSEDVVDPVSGRVVPADRNKTSGGVGSRELADEVRPEGA